MELADDERMDDVVNALEQIRGIDGVVVSGYEIQVRNPSNTGLNVTLGIKHSDHD